MTVTTTYMSDLGRVRVEFTNVPTDADYAVVERSVDGINWTTVRGGDTVALTQVTGSALNTNPDFETNVSGWTPAGCTFVQSADRAVSGTQSGKLTPDGVTANTRVSSTPLIAVTAGRTYTASCWIYAALGYSTGGGFSCSINWYDASSVYITTSSNIGTIPAATWTHATTTVTAPSNAAFAAIVPTLGGTAAGTDIVYLDVVTFQAVTLTGKLDDYEFDANTLNTYRVSFVDSALPIRLAVGTDVHTDNASLNPVIPLAGGPGATLLLFVAARGSGVPATPAGWTASISYGNVSVFTRQWAAGMANPTVTFTGGAAGDTNSAVISIYSNLNDVPTALNASNNTTPAQNIATPALSVPGANQTVFLAAWKADDCTASTVPSGFSAASVYASTLGNDQSLIVARATSAANLSSVGATTLTITGGTTAVSRAVIWSMARADYLVRETSTITPSLTKTWFKVISRPSLNTEVTVTWDGSVSRPSRTGLFDVLGRTMPVAVTDIQGSRRLTLTFITTGLDEAAEMDQRLASGEIVFVHAPDRTVPTGYFVIGDVTENRPAARALRRYFDVPLTEVAAPGATVFSDTYVYADVLVDFASYAAVLSGVTTYSNLIDRVSDNVVVIP